MIDTVLGEFIKFLQEASPFVWQTLVKQVYVEAISNVIWAVILAVGTILLFKIGRRGIAISKTDKYSMWEIFAPMAFVFAAIICAVSFILLTEAIAHVINPDFYAIKYILSALNPQ